MSHSQYGTESTLGPRRPYKVPSTPTLISRVTLELLALLVFCYPLLHLYIVLSGNAEPYKRGFFCDDETLKHPDLPEEISVGGCVAIWAAVVVVVVSYVELLYFSAFRYEKWESEISSRHCSPSWLSRIPWVAVELYRILGYCSFGGLATLLTSELAKYKIGRLRPYFLTACDPDYASLGCKDEFGYETYVTDYSCRGDPEKVREAMKSFLSGHSSFSSFCATFLVVYLHARLSSRQTLDCVKRRDRPWLRVLYRCTKVLRPFLQFAFVLLALYIAFTRISDYKHHPTDVVAGFLVGTLFAVLLLVYQVDLFRRPRSFRNLDYDDVGEMRGGGGERGDAAMELAATQANSSPNSEKTPFAEVAVERE